MIVHGPSEQKARRRYLCFWCGQAIEPGQRYVRWTWANDGFLDAVQVHPECRSAWQKLPPGENEIYFGSFSRGCTCERGRCDCGRGYEIDWRPDEMLPEDFAV